MTQQVTTTSLVTATPGIISRPSVVPYCPATRPSINVQSLGDMRTEATYKDCGSCFCVPETRAEMDAS